MTDKPKQFIMKKVEEKPKRTIQSAPKRGSIPKEKIEKAVKEIKAKGVKE